MMGLSEQVNGLDIGKQLKELGVTKSFMWWCKNPEQPQRYIISPKKDLNRIAPAFNASQLSGLTPESIEEKVIGPDGPAMVAASLHITFQYGSWITGYYLPNGEPVMEEHGSTLVESMARAVAALERRRAGVEA